MGAFGLTGASAGYGGVDVVREVTLQVESGTCVALLGPNGAGKSTLLRTLAGVLKPRRGQREIDGVETSGWGPHRIARFGLRWIGEPRPIYPSLSVDENLTIGATSNRRNSSRNRTRVYELLPDLIPKSRDRAGSLSGGQQQMLAIGQALMSEPRYLCLDEPSIGLAPRIVTHLADLIRALADDGVGILWAEQFPEIVMSRCDRVIVLGGGEIKIDCPPAELLSSHLDAAYMGMGSQLDQQDTSRAARESLNGGHES